MKSHLKIERIPPHTEEWYEYRKRGIGGSEIGALLGLHDYDTRMRLFAEKVGLAPPLSEDNEFMFWGREQEDKIAEVWQYWDGTKFDYINNYKDKKLIRKCRNINGFVINPKYPWLYASLDRVINKEGGLNMITGQPLDTECVLECKTLSYWASRAWVGGIPIYFLAQIHQYMIILECDYAEIAILMDGNKFWVEKIERNDEFCERIIRISKQFWYERVIPAREAKAKMDVADMEGRLDEAEKYDAKIQSLEPDPDATDAYKEYMEDSFVKEREMVQGTMELYELCKKDVVLRKILRLISKERLLLRNYLVKFLTKYGAELIDFGSAGKVSWTKPRNFKRRRLAVNIKEKPEDEIVEHEFKKMNLNCY